MLSAQMRNLPQPPFLKDCPACSGSEGGRGRREARSNNLQPTPITTTPTTTTITFNTTPTATTTTLAIHLAIYHYQQSFFRNIVYFMFFECLIFIGPRTNYYLASSVSHSLTHSNTVVDYIEAFNQPYQTRLDKVLNAWACCALGNVYILFFDYTKFSFLVRNVLFLHRMHLDYSVLFESSFTGDKLKFNCKCQKVKWSPPKHQILSDVMYDT